jgi:uncharacterized protein (DUF2147 family)
VELTRFFSIAVLAMVCGWGTARADVPIGLWQSNPDARGIVFHVRTRSCGSAICGQVERVKDRRGYDTPSQVVGHRVLVDLMRDDDGTFTGLVWEPTSNRMLRARMTMTGNLMRFENCSEDTCRKATWRRVR